MVFPDLFSRLSQTRPCRQTTRQLVLCLLLLQFSSCSEIHVDARTGSDSGDGTTSRPFATLARAQIAARRSLHEDLTVSIAAGAYYNTSLTFTEADSPSNGKRTTWQVIYCICVLVSGCCICVLVSGCCICVCLWGLCISVCVHVVSPSLTYSLDCVTHSLPLSYNVHTHTHTHSLTHIHSPSLVLVVMMKSKELKT